MAPQNVVLILGAAVWHNGPSPTLRRRTHHAARLWQTGQISHVIASGGMGQHGPTEAEAMRQILAQMSVPPEAISLEDRSTSTYENIRFSLPILEELRTDAVLPNTVLAQTVLIVSDPLHLPRALMTARHFGLAARGSAAAHGPGTRRLQLKQAAREALAYPAYAWRLRKAGIWGDKQA